MITPPSRLPSVPPANRPNGDDASALHAGPVASHNFPVQDPTLSDAALLFSVIVAAPSDAGAGAHPGGLNAGIPGQRPPGGHANLALASFEEKGIPEERPSQDPLREGEAVPAHLSRVGPRAGERSLDESTDAMDLPEPQLADLITTFLPSSRASLDYAIDRFLDPLDDLTSAVPELRGPFKFVPASLAVAVSLLALDMALRVRRPRGKTIGVDGEAGPDRFPGLPGLWRWSHR